MQGLNKLWIIHRTAGVCIFEQTFEELPKDIDGDMIGGFLIAILSFSKEITDQDISFLQLKDLRIIYHITELYIIAVAVAIDGDSKAIQSTVEKQLLIVEKRFNARYSDMLGGGYTGETSKFLDFAGEVEEIFDSKATTYKYFQEKTEDLKEFYKESQNKLNEWYNNLFGSEKTEDSKFELTKAVKSTVVDAKDAFVSFTNKVGKGFKKKFMKEEIDSPPEKK